MSGQTNILYIDIEGGWGGSSRSLFYLVKNLDRNRFNPTVITGQQGPIHEQYRQLNIQTFNYSPLPRYTALPKNSWKPLVKSVIDLFRSKALINIVKNQIRGKNIAAIHYNHESLVPLAIFMKALFRKKTVFHVRTRPPQSLWGKLQASLIEKVSDLVLFITENEREWWKGMGLRLDRVRHEVLYNFTEFQKAGETEEAWEKPCRGKFKIASLSNINQARGVDRLVDVAIELKKKPSIPSYSSFAGIRITRDRNPMRTASKKESRKPAWNPISAGSVSSLTPKTSSTRATRSSGRDGTAILGAAT